MSRLRSMLLHAVGDQIEASDEALRVSHRFVKRPVVLADREHITHTPMIGPARTIAAEEIVDALPVSLSEETRCRGVRLGLRGGRDHTIALGDEASAATCAEWVRGAMLGDRPRTQLLADRHHAAARMRLWLGRAHVDPPVETGTGLLDQPVLVAVRRGPDVDDLDLLATDGAGVGTLVPVDNGTTWQLRHLADEWVFACDLRKAEPPSVRAPDGSIVATLQAPLRGSWTERPVVATGVVVGRLERQPYLVRLLDNRVQMRDIDVCDATGCVVARLRSGGFDSTVLRFEDDIPDALRAIALFLPVLTT